jgi:cysteine synthase
MSGRYYNDITECIGNTPLVRIKSFEPSGVVLLGKLESRNPSFSVKDRIAYGMIVAAERDGRIDRHTIIVEPTSGNTGIGLAMVCAQRGYRLILTMPESMSIERRKLLARYGAEVSLTPSEKGMTGAVERAREIAGKSKNAFMPNQFENLSNPDAHYRTTGPEIWRDTDGICDVFIAGVGTGGTISGVGRFLKEKNANVQIVAVEPEDSPVISGGSSGPHRIQGIGAGFLPQTYQSDYVDDVVRVSNEEAYETAGKLARDEGILSGVSSGANVAAACRVAKAILNELGDVDREIVIVTVLCDTGERYLSIW